MGICFESGKAAKREGWALPFTAVTKIEWVSNPHCPKATRLWESNDIKVASITSYRRRYDKISTSCVHWVKIRDRLQVANTNICLHCGQGMLKD